MKLKNYARLIFPTLQVTSNLLSQIDRCKTFPCVSEREFPGATIRTGVSRVR